MLEVLWLPVKREPAGDYYKGLIQLAGAFVHLQKNRLRPAAALFRLAQANLAKYSQPPTPLDLAATQKLIVEWLERLEKGQFLINPLSPENEPKLTPPEEN